MIGKIISDPSSVEFLEEQLAVAQRNLASAKRVAEEREAQVGRLTAELRDLQNDQITQTHQVNAMRNDAQTAKQQIVDLSEKNTKLNNRLKSMQAVLKDRTAYLVLTSVFAAVMTAMQIYFVMRY